jgi:hypothetical protein
LWLSQPLQKSSEEAAKSREQRRKVFMERSP